MAEYTMKLKLLKFLKYKFISNGYVFIGNKAVFRGNISINKNHTYNSETNYLFLSRNIKM